MNAANTQTHIIQRSLNVVNNFPQIYFAIKCRWTDTILYVGASQPHRGIVLDVNLILDKWCKKKKESSSFDLLYTFQ